MVTKEELFQAISTVIDPEVEFNLVEMGLIYDATCDEKGNAKITMTLSTKACPLHQLIVKWVEEAVMRECPKVEYIEVNVVWEPVWNITMATPEVMEKLKGKL